MKEDMQRRKNQRWDKVDGVKEEAGSKGKVSKKMFF